MKVNFYKCIGLKEDSCENWADFFEIDGVYPSPMEYPEGDTIVLASKIDQTKLFTVDSSQFIEIDRLEVTSENGSFVHKPELKDERLNDVLRMMSEVTEAPIDSNEPTITTRDMIEAELSAPSTTPDRMNELLDMLIDKKK